MKILVCGICADTHNNWGLNATALGSNRCWFFCGLLDWFVAVGPFAGLLSRRPWVRLSHASAISVWFHGTWKQNEAAISAGHSVGVVMRPWNSARDQESSVVWDGRRWHC